MSLYKKIKSLGVEDDTAVTFSFEDGCDVFHFNETHIETAMSNTGIAYSLAEAITQGVLYDKGNEVLEEMRTEGLLGEYERGEEIFTDFVQEVIEENHYDYSWLDFSTEKYDYKRGYTTVTAEFAVRLGDLKGYPAPLPGWTTSVRTPNGYLTVER